VHPDYTNTDQRFPFRAEPNSPSPGIRTTNVSATARSPLIAAFAYVAAILLANMVFPASPLWVSGALASSLRGNFIKSMLEGARFSVG
jgi:hypothetical protein